MKKIYLILHFLASLLLASCTNSHIAEQPIPLDPDLLHIDSLMQSSPDSALQMLLSFRADSVISTEAQRSGEISCHYHSLLLSEALYKTDNVQSNRTELQAAMHYFDSLAVRYPDNDDIIMLSARSHYMNGVGYYENDSVVVACKEYLHTLEIMQNHFDVEKLRGYKAKFMGMTYNRLVDLFDNQIMTTPTIYCCKQALHYCMIEPTSRYGIANLLTTIGKQYHEMDNKDSASYYYNLALQSLPDYNNSRYRGIVSSLKLLDYQMGDNTEIVLDSLKSMLAKANNYNEKLTRYLTIGCIFYEEKQYDSAIVYLEKVYNDNDDLLSKMQAADYLREIYRNQGDTIKSNRFSEVLAGNTIKEYNKKVRTSKVNELFQQHLKHTANNNFIKEKSAARKQTAIIILPVSVLLVVIVFLITRKWGKKHIARHKKALEKTEDSLSEIKMKIEVKKFIDEPICQMILDIVKEQHFKSKIDYINYKDFALGNDQLMELRTAVNLHYDNFTIRLKDKFPEITNDDIDYCCLYLLGLKDADVSALMQKEYSTIRHRRNKIKSIIKTDKNLTEALYNLTRLSNTTN